MANAFYALGKNKLLTGGVYALLTDTIKAALVTTAYSPNLTTDEFYDDISANVVGTPQTLGTKTCALGVFDAADPTFPAVPSGSTLLGLAIYKDTGVPGTSPLLALLDTITGFPLATNGGDIQIVWDNGAYKIWSL
jgi:hypothetical protein